MINKTPGTLGRIPGVLPTRTGKERAYQAHDMTVPRQTPNVKANSAFDDDYDPFCDEPELPWEKYPVTSAKSLALEVKPVHWLVGGVWVEGSAGVLAGKKKVFKTWHLHSLSMSVATQLSYLDNFPVFITGPVLYLTGEGGEDEFRSRHQAIARRFNINSKELQDIGFHTMFSIASLDNSEFIDALKHHLDSIQPVLVVIDPLYAYHPKDVDVSNVYSRGQMLAQIRALIEPYAALIIGDHVNKSADDKTLDLDDIGFSGVSQWADSWSLQRHREPFKTVGADSFAKLEVEYGSRRTGSMRYHVDWHLERDMTDPHIIKWASCDWGVIARNPAVSVTVVISHLARISVIQDYLDANPHSGKTNTVAALDDSTQGSSRDEWRDSWDTGLTDGYIVSVQTTEERKYGKTTRPYTTERFKRGRPVGP